MPTHGRIRGSIVLVHGDRALKLLNCVLEVVLGPVVLQISAATQIEVVRGGFRIRPLLQCLPPPGFDCQRQFLQHIIEEVILQSEDVVRVPGDGVGRDLSVRARIDQAPRDADARAILLQAAFEHEVSAELAPCLVGGLHALRDQLTGRDQLHVSAIDGLHQSRRHGLGQPEAQGVRRRIVRYRFERQNRHHPFSGAGASPR